MTDTDKKLIDPDTENFDKQRTYKTMFSRYHAAVKNEFYFEALLIIYAMMEDSLRSFICRLGGFATRDSLKIESKEKKHIKEMVLSLNAIGNHGIASIAGKMQIVRAVILCQESLYE